MMVNILGVISQWERETIGERTQAALEYKKKTGSAYNGYPLYGYQKVDGKLVRDPKGAGHHCCYFRNEPGRVPCFKNMPELERRGVRTRHGSGRWHSKVVKKIVTDIPVRNKIDTGCVLNEAA